jgi:Spy/CpxP family protein refolding chaperone
VLPFVTLPYPHEKIPKAQPPILATTKTMEVSMKLFKSFLLLFTCGAFLMSCNRTPDERANKMVKIISYKLDLNDGQKQKLSQLKDSIMEAKKRRAPEKKVMHDEMKKLVRAKTIDEAAVKDLVMQKEKMIAEEFPAIFIKLQAFHSSLSDEQKEKVVQFMDKIHSKKGHFSSFSH